MVDRSAPNGGVNSALCGNGMGQPVLGNPWTGGGNGSFGRAGKRDGSRPLAVGSRRERNPSVSGAVLWSLDHIPRSAENQNDVAGSP